MTVSKTIGDYTYSIELLNLFDHSDFGQRYVSVLMSVASRHDDIKEKLKAAADLKSKDDISVDDALEISKLDREATALCVARLSSDEREQLKQMRMTAVVEGKCQAKRISDESGASKPIYMKEVFNNHFRNHSNPREMSEVMEWALAENVKGFLQSEA